MNHSTIVRAAFAALAVVAAPAGASTEPVHVEQCAVVACVAASSGTITSVSATSPEACYRSNPPISAAVCTPATGVGSQQTLSVSPGGLSSLAAGWQAFCRTDTSGFAVAITAEIYGPPGSDAWVRCTLYVDGSPSIPDITAYLPAGGGYQWAYGKNPNTGGSPWCVRLQARGPNGDYLDTADCPQHS